VAADNMRRDWKSQGKVELKGKKAQHQKARFGLRYFQVYYVERLNNAT
jgi:hypothetical protein